MGRGGTFARVLALGTVIGVLLGTAATPVPAGSACPRGRVALTFDDGPHAVTTPKLLATLDAKGVAGTFFVIGEQVRRHGALVRRSHRRGHAVANHTYGHDALSRLSDAGIASTIKRTHAAIRDVGGHPRRTVRPPFGATNSRVSSVLAANGFSHSYWSVDPQDWRSGRSAATIRSVVNRDVHPGAVVVMHDYSGNYQNTFAAVRGIVNDLRAKGYCFGVLNHAGRIRPPVPAVSVGRAEAVERDDGERRGAKFRVRLSVRTWKTVTVDYRTRDGSAVAGRDYRHTSGTLTFAPDQRIAYVRIPVVGDTRREATERFSLRLSSPANARLATRRALATILGDD